MIFKQYQQVLDGTKTQTRRPVKEGETVLFDAAGIAAVYSASGRVKWVRGFSYAVQPGRGKKSLGRTDPLKAIRQERLQEISPNDCRAEGITDDDISAAWGPVGGTSIPIVLKHSFKALWNSLYRSPHHWEDNPEVWVLQFERVKEPK